MCGVLFVDPCQFDQPPRLLFMHMGLCDELLRFAFVGKTHLPQLVGLQFVRLRLLENFPRA